LPTSKRSKYPIKRSNISVWTPCFVLTQLRLSFLLVG
jgi:hypothetical protein